MPSILYKVKLRNPLTGQIIMYALLSNGAYTKTYNSDKGVTSDYIDRQEYASAIAHVFLRT